MPQTQHAAHPLDPLSAEEYRQVTAILRREKRLGDQVKFTSIRLREPAKQLVKEFPSTQPVPREADVVCWDRSNRHTYTGVVSLRDESVANWNLHPGGQANLTIDEFDAVDKALRRDPRAIAELAKRSIFDIELVTFEIWGYPGYLVPEAYKDRRIGWTDVWFRNTPESNVYANPVSGLKFMVDLDTLELLEVQSRFAVQRAAVMGEYAPALVPGLTLRDDLKPLAITQPEGPSFTLEGNVLSWQKWSMRIGFNNREGLVLHQVGYQDDGRVRSIANRMSFAEVIVPYRDASPDHYRRTAFDAGEWGLGFMATSLTLGCDCKGEIRYLDETVHDWDGEPITIKNAICIHEEDDGILWKHVDPKIGAEVRRARRLVVSFHATVANYEYLVYWRFYQDANIECEVRATGIMITTQFPHGAQPVTGTLVDTDTYSPFHQHFVVARLDLDIDGESNTVYATQCVPLPIGPENETGMALGVVTTPLRTEQDGIQDYDWHTQKSWKIVNDHVVNPLGTPVGYKLVPDSALPAMLDPSSPLLKHAGVIAHTLWVTPYDQNENWPCGDLVVQSKKDLGLPAWTKANRKIDNTDVVLWYVFGLNHIPRPEEWPIMSVDKMSFWLKPAGFFGRNPALDVPPEPGSSCHSS